MAQQKVGRYGIRIFNTDNLPSQDFVKEGALKVKVRYLIDERHGSNYFSLRLYTVEGGGHTSLDVHVHEHQVYVLSGEGALKVWDGEDAKIRILHRGDAIFIPSYARHQFFNEHNEPFQFLCVKGNPALYSSRLSEEGNIESRNDLKSDFC